MLQSLMPFILVGAGSMAGGITRYGMTLATRNLAVFSLPWGTLVSNVAG
jgi:fluoride ion exporter CrcB/FEX